MRMCEADVPNWDFETNKIKYRPCSAKARVRIADTDLCLIHAGRIAIRKLIAEGGAEAIKQESYNAAVCQYKQ